MYKNIRLYQDLYFGTKHIAPRYSLWIKWSVREDMMVLCRTQYFAGCNYTTAMPLELHPQDTYIKFVWNRNMHIDDLVTEIFNMVSHAWFSRNLHVTCLIHESPYNQNGISKHITAKGALIIGVACDCQYRIRIPFVVGRYLLVYFNLHNFMQLPGW